MPPEWGGAVPPQVFLDEASRIASQGEAQGVYLRAMGGVAVRLHASQHSGLADRLARLGESRQEFTDLDFMAYRKQRKQVGQLFASLDYQKRRATLSSAASERQIYFHPRGWFFVDVFFDKLLVANHPLDFRGRLELDSPTIPVTDLLLTKLQIVAFSQKDLKDTMVLLIAHQVGGADDPKAIDGDHIAGLLSRDWGFWYTCTTNLRNIQAILPDMDTLEGEERDQISGRIDALLERIEREPKSRKWRLRSRIGTRLRWYEIVETTDALEDFGIWKLREPGGKPS
jgi:hypothetical protein